MADTDIQGTVTDPSGNSLQNAEVYLFRSDEVGNSAVVAKTTTDSNGDFIFNSHPDGNGNSTDYHVLFKFDDGSGTEYQFTSQWGVTAQLS
jgi:hypothetical protein